MSELERLSEGTLIGRARELEQLAALIAAAAAGHGSSVMLRGEPGVGKTALIDQVTVSAGGFRVLRCRGVQTEVELPFSGLQTLLMPLIPAAKDLPDGQREALLAALAMEAAQPASIVNASMGALTLIAGAAAVDPVLLIVDDVHWMDEPSLLVLAFIARRVAHDRVLLLMAARDTEVADVVDAQQISLSALAAAEVAELAERLVARPLLPTTASAITSATGGNPLAVIETVRLLGSAIDAFGTSLDDPPPPSELIERGFASRLANLSPATSEALLVVATALSDSVEVILDAIEHLGLGPGTLDEAENGGVIVLGPNTASFSHPLLRALVFHRATPVARRRCHAALATASRERGAQAWHAAAASPRADEQTAANLADSAREFERRGGMLASARALERAAQLTPDATDRARRLKLAGVAARSAGRPSWARELLDEAYDGARSDRVLQLEIEAERIALQAGAGSNAGLIERQLQLVDDATGISDEITLDALAMVVSEGLFQSRPESSLAALTRIRELPEPLDPKLAVHIAAAEANLLANRGGEDERVRSLVLGAIDRAQNDVAISAIGIVEVLKLLEEDDLADRLLSKTIRHAQGSGDLVVLVAALWSDGYRAFRCGDWAEADLALEQALQIAQARSLLWNAAAAAALQAVVRGAQGDATTPALVALVDEMSSANAYRFDHFTTAAGGLRALAHGHASEAVAQLERCEAYAKETGHLDPSHLSWPADLVEAHLLAGDRPKAVAARDWLRQRLDIANRKLGWAMLARVDGMLAEDDAFEASFEHGLRLHQNLTSPFELARTQLHYGRRLRRAGLRSRAQGHLSEAARIFERLSAAPWLEQARAELHTAGGTVPAGASGLTGALLTAQEKAVADLVAQGMTNKAVAAQLFLTPKTIEWHLRQIYRKLGIKSRTQLAAWMHQTTA